MSSFEPKGIDSPLPSSRAQPPPPPPSPPPLSSSHSSATVNEIDQDPSRHDFSHQPSNWGEEISVAKPIPVDAPGFEQLQRALTGHSLHDGGVDEWSLEKQLKGTKKALYDQGITQEKKLDVAWSNLSVRGVGKDAMFGDDMGSLLNPFTKLLDARRSKLSHASDGEKIKKDDGLGKNERYLLKDFNGLCRSGEMALVIGRPGSGCTTFLKTITNNRDGYAGVDGEVHFGDMSAKEAQKYPGQIIFNAEDDTHYPVLTVAQTLQFALKMKTPRVRPNGQSRKQYESELLETLLKTFGIEHARDTVVGNENVRGVSGGERKRVSIAEVLVNRASVVAWDNSTRGLDASTALEYTRSLRTLTDVLGSTTFVSLYQAGNQIYDLFDKVLVIAAGECIYWGPRSAARPYFEGLGFVVAPGSNIADYLTGVTVATERIIDESKRASAPISIEQFVAAYRASDVCHAANAELEQHLAAQHVREAQSKEFREVVGIEGAKSVRSSQFTNGLWTQVKACTVQQYELLWNDKTSILIKQGSSVVQSLINGSLFYALPQTTNGIFTRGGTLFFILLFNALLSMTEVTVSFQGRAILAKHKSFSMYRPGAVVLAKVLADFPILVAQITIFLLPIYFMSALKDSGSSFMTLWSIVYISTLGITAFFRAIGFNFSTFEDASAVSGMAIGLLILYAGYLVPQSSMKPWLSWTRWLDPLYYGLEAAMANEFHDLDFKCVGTSLIPSGPEYADGNSNSICSVLGSVVGEDFVGGDAYLKTALGFSHTHLARNIGVMIGLWVFLVFLTVLGVERLKSSSATKSYLLFQRTSDKKQTAAITNGGRRDEEEGDVSTQPIGEQHSSKERPAIVEKSTTVFTWNHLDYTVPVKGGERQLLNSVQGYTKPGTLTALMGASGAGKTTLLDVLALRKDEGVVSGDILVDGRPLGPSFQRTTGYVGQMDLHDPTATVREALIFSALLRQPAETPYEEKIAFVDTVIDLLELTDLQHAFIGNGLAGLGVEQKKRVTIGVELVAKPILLFLDEPTSGLDGQSSFNILRFLRKLADEGYSMLVTIHQPSALLFSQFDRLLLLARGGHTVYFGDLGDQGAVMKEYFARNGIECPEDANPAEFMIDVVSGSLSKDKNWNEIWLNSPEYAAVTKEIVDLNAECAAKPPSYEEDGKVYASSMLTQLRLVSKRSTLSMYRDVGYIQGKLGLHVGTALINSLSFLQLDNSVASLQNRLFTVFQGMFIAPGLLNQVQPRFLNARLLFEGREKQSMTFHWFPFVVGQLVGELPWLVICTTIYFVIWLFVTFPIGLITDPTHAGGMFAMLLFYHFFTLMFGMAIAAISRNAQQAALVVPIFLAIFAGFSGTVVPYSQITAFWRYWLYYLNPWNYMLGGQVFFSMRDLPIVCKDREFARFPPPSNQTCGEYLQPFLATLGSGYVDNPSATDECKFCQYGNANEYLETVNLNTGVSGGRNIGITILYTFAFTLFVFLFMMIRSRRPKKKVKTA